MRPLFPTLTILGAALLAACSLSLDFYDGIPCTSGADCLHDYRCHLGTCAAPNGLCGDQVVDPGEDCDDGNDAGGDLCDPSCHAVPCDGGGHLGDADNCAACGHSCAGGACEANRCRPSEPLGGLQSAGPLHVTADDLYFAGYDFGATYYGVWRLPKAGGPVDEVIGNLPSSAYMAVDATHVYLLETEADNGRLLRVPLAGGGGTPLASDCESGSAVAVGGDGLVYFADYPYPVGGPRMRRVDPLSPPPEPLYSGATVLTIAAGADAVYWSDFEGRVMRRLYGGGSNDTLRANGTKVVALAVDADHLYRLGRAESAGGSTGALERCDLDGTGCIELATDLYGGEAIDVDADYVYVGTWSGVHRVRNTGGSLELLQSSANAVSVVAVDGPVLWYVEYGVLKRLALPPAELE